MIKQLKSKIAMGVLTLVVMATFAVPVPPFDPPGIGNGCERSSTCLIIPSSG
ncbi:MAG: hypothetical protein AAF490_27945 [Chloroflexota bacterium]